MGQGWICLHRKVRDCELLWNDKPFSRGQAWIDLLLMANHEDKEILFNGTYRKIERGEMLTSLTKLSNQWGWSRKKTTKFLNELKMAHMLDLKSDNKSTAITIINYGLYQDMGTTKEPQKSSKRTSEEHQRNTNNNDITMINNENKSNMPFQTVEKETPEHAYNKYTNIENTKYILNNKLFDEWEYIKANPELWNTIKEWMEYKDAKIPRKTHHYQTERGIKGLLRQFVNYTKEYGVQTVKAVVDDSIAAEYTGILWDKLAKKKKMVGSAFDDFDIED